LLASGHSVLLLSQLLYLCSYRQAHAAMSTLVICITQ
jgi:hypothetical protein